jgi:hypothetical protein
MIWDDLNEALTKCKQTYQHAAHPRGPGAGLTGDPRTEMATATAKNAKKVVTHEKNAKKAVTHEKNAKKCFHT